MNNDEYRKSLKKAAIKTEQQYTGSHGLRWNYAQERYEKILRINRDLFEGIDIGLLDYTHILAAQEAMVHRGLSANSIGMYNRNLRTMYNRAVARGIVEDASPWKRATTAVAKTKSRALSDTQFKALLAINMDEFYKWGGGKRHHAKRV